MGRHSLYEWTQLQLIQACIRREPPTTYADFVQAQVAAGKIDLASAESAHTASWLHSCQAGTPTLPNEFFVKLGIGCAAC